MNPLLARSRVKYVLNRAVPGGTPPTSNQDFWTDENETGTPWVAIADMTAQPKIHSTTKLVTDAGIAAAGLELLPQSTLLFAMYASLGTTAVLGIPAVTNQAILGLMPASTTSCQFMQYWLQALQPSLHAFSRSNTQDNLNAEVFGNLPFPEVSFETQRKIADFLDRETERIDALIDKKRRLIDLLEEKRTATITHAVTKGLDPTSPMKDSGIPWIGEIPLSWRVAPIRRVASFRNSNVDKKTVDDETPVALCNYTDVYYGTYLDSTAEFMMASATTDEILRFHLEEDTVIITKDSESADDIGVPAYVATPLDAVCAYHLAILAPVRSIVTGEFLYWVLESASLRQAFETHAQGVTRFGLTRDGIGSPSIPVPEVSEQQAIVDRLRALDRQVHELVQGIDSQLSLLAEYREALITAAVTGEIDVDTFDSGQATERTAS